MSGFLAKSAEERYCIRFLSSSLLQGAGNMAHWHTGPRSLLVGVRQTGSIPRGGCQRHQRSRDGVVLHIMRRYEQEFGFFFDKGYLDRRKVGERRRLAYVKISHLLMSRSVCQAEILNAVCSNSVHTVTQLRWSIQYEDSSQG